MQGRSGNPRRDQNSITFNSTSLIISNSTHTHTHTEGEREREREFTIVFDEKLPNGVREGKMGAVIVRVFIEVSQEWEGHIFIPLKVTLTN